jgi:hypothetical protein
VSQSHNSMTGHCWTTVVVAKLVREATSRFGVSWICLRYPVSSASEEAEKTREGVRALGVGRVISGQQFYFWLGLVRVGRVPVEKGRVGLRNAGGSAKLCTDRK